MELEIYSPTKDGFVKEITWNHEQIKQEVAEKVKKYSAVVYTDDQIQDAKADRAKLRKFVDVLETKRKEIKKQCLAPYEAFEKQMKEITAIVNEPILMIDKQVKEYEEIKKAEKRDAIESYWISLSEDGKIPEDITLDRIFNEKWLNASVTLKTVCTEINARLEQIEKDLATLAELPEFAFEGKEVYKHTLDLNQAIGEGKRLAEIQKRKAEAEAAVNCGSSKPAEAVNEPEITPADPFEQIPKQWISFRACLSTADAMALKNFFTARNIQFEAIRGEDMKGYTDFAAGFLGAGAVATKPIGQKKFMDWQKVKQIVQEHPKSTICAGLQEDWGNTSGLIYKNGKYYDGGICFYGCSVWATPILDVDGEEIECWTYEKTAEGSGIPEWWGEGQQLLEG